MEQLRYGIAMRIFVGVTDNQWFRFLRRLEPEEVNFWQPSGSSQFRALSPGELFLFKLHAPENFIVGGGFYATFSILPCSRAWETFSQENGVGSLHEMRARIELYRRIPPRPHEDYLIGCLVLVQPFFLEDSEWIPVPPDFARNIVRGRGYDAMAGTGAELLAEVRKRLSALPAIRSAEYEAPIYGEPIQVRPRLGQGAFRVLVTDTYERRCAVTGEKVLPVLEAAHIRPVSDGGRHEISNGLLLRSDLHRLFDRGYLTVTPGLQVMVSRKLRDDFHNGEEYMQLRGAKLWVPRSTVDRPDPKLLEWHADTVFAG